MKKILIFCFCCFLFSGCFFNTNGSSVNPVEHTYKPILMSKTDFEKSVYIEGAKAVEEASKIYIIGNYIFINDKRKGFHIFDNSNPSNPIKKKFLNAPGATDIAIRNNNLYINQATDLVVLTFNFNTLTTTVNKRVKDVFPVLISPEGQEFVDGNNVVVNWVKK